MSRYTVSKKGRTHGAYAKRLLKRGQQRPERMRIFALDALGGRKPDMKGA